MQYDVDYSSLPEDQKDEKAIRDILDYLGMDKAALFGDLVALAVAIEHEIPCMSNDGKARVQKLQGLNATFGFAGITGFPFHAFCRRYCPTKYKEWVES